MDKSTKVPPAFMVNWDKNRATEQAILRRLVDALCSDQLSPLVRPENGYVIDPNGGVVGVFLPRAGIAIWVSPIINFHFENQIDASNIMVMFSVCRGYLTQLETKGIYDAIMEHAGEWLNVHIDELVGDEPPQTNRFLWDQIPTYRLWLSQRRKMAIDDWAKAVNLACAGLYGVRQLDDSGLATSDPLLSCRMGYLNISQVCHILDGELLWPGAAYAGIENLLCPDGSAEYAYAKIDGYDKTWTFQPDLGRVVTAHETVPRIRNIREVPALPRTRY